MRALTLSALLLGALPTAWAIDCGRLPRGRNPTLEDLDREIAALSAKHNVPTEVIKAIAWQESGCQQWRADGSFVYNKTDCGLGMMQLTGATARQFDVERLKDDWRYNLECGVRVLTHKWARAQRQGQVGADPKERRILENWYYPIAYYWGGKVESYLRKIFAHMKKRPGRLARLMRRSVEVSIASEVIPGFRFGDPFTALEGDRFVDKEGRVHRAPTHLGTIGDPRTLARLDTLLARGRKAAERGQARKAAKYLGAVLASDLDTHHKSEAQALLERLVAEARAQLAASRAREAEGDLAAALSIARKVARAYKGLEVGAEAAARVRALKDKARADR
ncbi:MAG: hypothetical protein D6731_19960 [Planctomycetota bacterium]|nr:MAG: hypothetical protein D6731_19960 [Planctomycetota bacterium]